MGSKYKKFLLAMVSVFVFITTSTAQHVNLDFIFGIHVPKPYVNSKTPLKSEWSHNFWMGLNYKKNLKSSSALNCGLILNGINYRFTNTDSPQTTFLTMTYLSVPLQLELPIKKSKISFAGGIEPKYTFSGHEYTASPSSSKKIDFTTTHSNYTSLNLALKTGVKYSTKGSVFFLQFSSDLYPFFTYKTTRIFDNKLSFGFVMFPIYKK